MSTNGPSLGDIVAVARRGELRLAEGMAEAAAGAMRTRAAEAGALANIRGGIAFERGCLDLAETCFEAAIRLAGEQGDSRLVAKATNNLGSIAHLRGKATLASTLYSSALEVCRQQGDAPGEARAEHNLGAVQRSLCDFEAAQLTADRAVAAARRAGDSALLGLTLTGAAEVAIERGLAFQARRLLVEARRLARATEDQLGLAEVRRLQGLLAFRSGHCVVALRHATAAYLLAQRLGSPQLSGECALLCAQAAAGLQQRRLAGRFRSRAHESFRSIGAAAELRRLALLSSVA